MPKQKITFTDETGQEHDLESQNDAEKMNSSNDNIKSKRSPGALFIVFMLILALIMGAAGSLGILMLLSNDQKLMDKLGLSKLNITLPIEKTEKIKIEESSAITDAVGKITPAVVSINTSVNVTDVFGRSMEQTGGGSGFILTSDGLIATNKHVVNEEGATYKVFTADGKEYDAKVLATDPYNDLAILKIDATGLPTLELGDSDDVKIGQWVIAVGNALGEFQNTVTVGVISAKQRQITASGGGQSETLEGLLQTDAAINPGNSGGPLVNLAGKVIGINVAVAGQAESIGFAIPINSVKTAIDSIKKNGEIKRPMLGIRYVPITKEVAKLNNLTIDYGAWILPGQSRGEVAVVPGSPADKAGLTENDIILEINGQRVDQNNSLTKILSQYNVGDEVTLKYLHKGDEKTVKVKLDEMK